jgi:hypothetical protein
MDVGAIKTTHASVFALRTNNTKEVVMAAKVFVSVSAALDAVHNMAIGQRIVVMGRDAHVANGFGAKVIQYDRQSVTTTARPADGRKYVPNYGQRLVMEAE